MSRRNTSATSRPPMPSRVSSGHSTRSSDMTWKSLSARIASASGRKLGQERSKRPRTAILKSVLQTERRLIVESRVEVRESQAYCSHPMDNNQRPHVSAPLVAPPIDIPAGSTMMIRWDSANRDEAKFEDPETFDIDRSNLRRHTAFGHGKHFCIGNGLARLELKATISAMLDRFAHIALAAPVERALALDNCALPALHLTLERAVKRPE
ncbi:cytochrome P450 [Sphingobium sp. JS3065]|uniref:cytochrome P450 n=1 Tax=Sphingobium sp. JS3065 TaxID=2970925 RepID=UPI00226402AB|nr:cytochrome P450 [Sphingobium sp. JS3065]UZW57031.1 cytochrome P450 [Sphingobium sp. JS3065]